MRVAGSIRVPSRAVAAILNAVFARVFSGRGSVSGWVEFETGAPCGQGGRMAAAAMEWSRWGQSWKTTYTVTVRRCSKKR